MKQFSFFKLSVANLIEMQAAWLSSHYLRQKLSISLIASLSSTSRSGTFSLPLMDYKVTIYLETLIEN